MGALLKLPPELEALQQQKSTSQVMCCSTYGHRAAGLHCKAARPHYLLQCDSSQAVRLSAIAVPQLNNSRACRLCCKQKPCRLMATHLLPPQLTPDGVVQNLLQAVAIQAHGSLPLQGLD